MEPGVKPQSIPKLYCNILKSTLLFIISIMLISCHGKGTPKSTLAEGQILAIGNPVDQLDEKIWVIFQDQKSNYWFGSKENGVYLYNGNSLRHITEKDGLVDNAIRGFQEDKFGNVFIETPKGISKYNGKSFTTLQVVKSSSDDWKLEPDDLWFSCNGNANDLFRYDGKDLYQLLLPRQDIEESFTIPATQFSENPYSVFGIAKDKKGNPWFGTVEAGVYRYDGKSFLWFGEKELSQLEDGRVPGIRSIIEDKEGNFWFSNVLHKYRLNLDTTYQKLEGIDFSSQEVSMKLPYFTSAVVHDKDDSIWMTTYSEGVWNYDGETLSNFRVTELQQDVLFISVFQDADGTLWFGTDNSGVYTYDGDSFKKFTPKK